MAALMPLVGVFVAFAALGDFRRVDLPVVGRRH